MVASGTLLLYWLPETQTGSGSDFTITLLFLFRQADAGQFKITQRVIDRFLLRGIQRWRNDRRRAGRGTRWPGQLHVAQPGCCIQTAAAARARLFVGFTRLGLFFTERFKSVAGGEKIRPGA